MTLNGVMALILRYFAEFGSFQGPLRESRFKIHRHVLQQKCRPKNLVISDISFMAIFAVDHP